MSHKVPNMEFGLKLCLLLSKLQQFVGVVKHKSVAARRLYGHMPAIANLNT